jgi:hypothetical protein
MKKDKSGKIKKNAEANPFQKEIEMAREQWRQEIEDWLGESNTPMEELVAWIKKQKSNASTDTASMKNTAHVNTQPPGRIDMLPSTSAEKMRTTLSCTQATMGILSEMYSAGAQTNYSLQFGPLSPNRNFISRKIEEIDSVCFLRSKFQEDRFLENAPTLILYSEGKTGKTEIVKNYCYAKNVNGTEFYKHKCFIDASSHNKLLTAYSKIAKKQGIIAKKTKHTIENVKKLFELLASQGGLLLIFDNVKERSKLDKFLPKDGKMHIILTTRINPKSNKNSELGLQNFPAYEVKGFSQEEGLDFLGKKVVINDEDERIGAEIAYDLSGGQPIILSHIAGCMIINKWAYQNFVSNYPDNDNLDKKLLIYINEHWTRKLKVFKENHYAEFLFLAYLLYMSSSSKATTFLSKNYLAKIAETIRLVNIAQVIDTLVKEQFISEDDTTILVNKDIIANIQVLLQKKEKLDIINTSIRMLNEEIGKKSIEEMFFQNSYLIEYAENLLSRSLAEKKAKNLKKLNKTEVMSLYWIIAGHYYSFFDYYQSKRLLGDCKKLFGLKPTKKQEELGNIILIFWEYLTRKIEKDQSAAVLAIQKFVNYMGTVKTSSLFGVNFG